MASQGDRSITSSTRCARRGFSIIELIVVILIIVIIMAILLPALGGARNVARKTQTQALIQQLVAAAGRFEQDHRRLPGYFSPTEMGSPDQFAGAGSGRGMSSMENVMLDLAGGILSPSGGSGGGGGGGPTSAPQESDATMLARNVGPTKDKTSQVTVDTSKIGVSLNGFAPYFVPDNKFYKPQFKTVGKGVAQNSAPPHADTPNKERAQLPDLLDAFGTPILAWTMDETATQPINGVVDFAKTDSGTGRARFYWNSNSCFLSANSVGQKQVNMSDKSLLGSNINAADRNTALVALLGNPGFPIDRQQSYNNILPSAPRGRFVIHAAGADGVYLGKDEAGAKHGDNGKLYYGLNFKNKNDNVHLDNKDQPTTIDLINDFDDIVVSGGN